MPPSDYTEDTLVQQTTTEYLEKEFGWESVYAYNNLLIRQKLRARFVMEVLISQAFRDLCATY